MKCSVIIAVLDSHEMFRRQILLLNQILPNDFEVIVIDDGSEIPLIYNDSLKFPFQLLYTNDRRPWTQHKARNIGAAHATGEYFLMTDIDHILSPQALQDVERFQGDMLKFSRQVGHLDEQGRICEIGVAKRPAPNIFAIKREVFALLGGYEETYGVYGMDRGIRQRYQRLVTAGRVKQYEVGETIYVITEAKWFHKLQRNM